MTIWKNPFRRDKPVEKESETSSLAVNVSKNVIESAETSDQTHSNGEQVMPNTLVTPENLSKELLASIYDAAFMETSWDDDGDLRVKDGIRCFVLPSENKDRIRFLSIFGFTSSSSEPQRLTCVNNINNEYVLVNAVAGANDTLLFKHDLYVEGGITKKNLVLATKRFLNIPQAAIADHGIDIVN